MEDMDLPDIEMKTPSNPTYLEAPVENAEPPPETASQNSNLLPSSRPRRRKFLGTSRQWTYLVMFLVNISALAYSLSTYQDDWVLIRRPYDATVVGGYGWLAVVNSPEKMPTEPSWIPPSLGIPLGLTQIVALVLSVIFGFLFVIYLCLSHKEKARQCVDLYQVVHLVMMVWLPFMAMTYIWTIGNLIAIVGYVYTVGTGFIAFMIPIYTGCVMYLK